MKNDLLGMDRDTFLHKIEHNGQRLLTMLRWSVFAVICGAILGVVGSLFVVLVNLVTGIRMDHPAFMLLLPVGAVLIHLFYHVLGRDGDAGTNLVISSIQSGESIPITMVPTIFFSTIFSHLCGASVGREGAALQLGGSIGHSLGRLFRFSEKDYHVMVMAGMSASFSAIFGTPMAAAFFSMEVVSVGIMHYAALMPCVIASFTARYVSITFFHQNNAHYIIESIPNFDLVRVLHVCILALLCGLVSILLCVTLHTAGKIGKRFKNGYMKNFVLGCVVLGLTLLFPGQVYNGTGVNIIHMAIAGEITASQWYLFLLKILFTAVSLSAGYKGGEIVPTFFVGATFGCWFGNLVGFNPSLCAACGMGALFCGVTNSPISALLICLDLFGMEGMPYYLLSVAIAYMSSSYYGLYSSQKIVYSKYNSNYINKKTQ